MGSTTAYECDGPQCHALTTREAGARSPAEWPRLTLHSPVVDTKVSGSFHDRACALAWLNLQLDVGAV